MRKYDGCVFVRERNDALANGKLKYGIPVVFGTQTLVLCSMYLFIIIYSVPHAFVCKSTKNECTIYGKYAIGKSVFAIGRQQRRLCHVTGNGVPITVNCIESTINYY